jgi:hypothetical protein
MGNGGTWVANNQEKYEQTTNTQYGRVFGDIHWFKNPPAMENQTFLGWFTQPENGKQITEYSQVEGNKTYYAHWDVSGIKKYWVFFDASGGAGGWRRKMRVGESIVPPEVFLEGNTFTGWLPEVD